MLGEVSQEEGNGKRGKKEEQFDMEGDRKRGETKRKWERRKTFVVEKEGRKQENRK